MAEYVPTYFATAERATPEDIARQRRYFCDDWFFGELMHFVPDLVLILNSHRQIVYANHAALAFAGAPDLSSILGLRPGELFHCIHADETGGGCGTTQFCRYCGAVSAILQSQKGQPTVEECRVTVERNGSEEALDLRVWANAITPDGEPFTFFAIADIAEEKRRLFLERIFLHDIMNTAMALQGFSGMLTSERLTAEIREEFIQRIAALSDRIIDEIVAHRVLVAAENSELTPDVKPLNSLEILEGLFGSYSRPEVLGSRCLKIAEGSATVVFESDPTLLGRVIENMIKNAIEASVPGETVTMGCGPEDRFVVFWIYNRSYMPENIRLQVFNRSFSTKGVGRGLGTYSMKYLTEKYLDGKISFTSTEEEGTTFIARYPLHLRRAPR